MLPPAAKAVRQPLPRRAKNSGEAKAGARPGADPPAGPLVRTRMPGAPVDDKHHLLTSQQLQSGQLLALQASGAPSGHVIAIWVE